jgi:sensor histidine kinase regulating citrate/malate metabolism
MLGNLSARAIVPVAVTVTGFVLVCCILLYSVFEADLTRDAVQHSVSLADTVAKSTRYAMLRADRETLRNIVDNVGDQDHVEHLRIFDKKGLIKFSHDVAESGRYVDKTTAGCLGCHLGTTPTATLEAMQQARRFTNGRGAEVLAVTVPIYNEPACSGAACHVHPPGQQILGILDIGLDTAPLRNTLATMRGRMAVFMVMVLILTVGGVTALLRRNVLLPVRQLADFTAQAVDGNLVRDFAEADGEIGMIAANVSSLRRRLDHALRDLDARRAEPAAMAPTDDDHRDPADAERLPDAAPPA